MEKKENAEKKENKKPRWMKLNDSCRLSLARGQTCTADCERHYKHCKKLLVSEDNT